MSRTQDNRSLARNAGPVTGPARRWLPLDAASVRLLAITAVLFLLMSVLNPGRFLTWRNLTSMGFQFPELGLFALAVALSLITGGIDLSVISIGNLTAILAASILTAATGGGASSAWPAAGLVAAFAAALLASALCGWINGLLISRLRITPILATLGTMQLYMGICLVITRGHAIAGFPAPVQFLGNGAVAGVPLPLLIFAALTGATHLLLSRTRLGVSLCLLGTNPTAARYSGLDVPRLLRRTYVITALLSGVAGLVILSRTNSAKADYGSSYLLQAVLVAILGGVNPRGGFGSAWGILLAVLSLQFLSSGLNMLQLNDFVGPYINNFTKEFTWGALLLIVMVANARRP